MNTDKVPFTFFEYDVAATVSTEKIFIEPLIMSSLQNVAEFVAGGVQSALPFGFIVNEKVLDYSSKNSYNIWLSISQ